MSEPNVIIDALAEALGLPRQEVERMTWNDIEKGMRRLEKEREAAQSDLDDINAVIAVFKPEA